MNTLPKIVVALTHHYDAWIIGSAADPQNESPRDWDVIVPFSRWREAASLIPKDATPNSFGGWKIKEQDQSIDIWPGELNWVMKFHGAKFLWNPFTNHRFVRTIL